MGLIDAIIEGIGNVILTIAGIFVFFLGGFLMATSKGTVTSIIGLILVIIGLGMLVAKYKR